MTNQPVFHTSYNLFLMYTEYLYFIMYMVLEGSFAILVSTTLRSIPLDALMSLLNCCPVSICSLRAL